MAGSSVAVAAQPPAQHAAPPPPARRAARLRLLGPPAAYLALSLLFFGRGVWRNPDAAAIGADEFDPAGFIWCLAWWPNALLDGRNPFITDAIFVPEGYNLTWAASIPGPALLLAPLTLLTSATVSYNLLMALAPALSAWAAYALCRHITGATWASLAAGYLFGFSSYMLGSMRGGAPNLAMMALVPLMVLLVVRRADGSLAAGPFVALMAGAMVLQLLTGSEVMMMTTVFGAATLGLAYLLLAERRRALRDTAISLVAAYAVAGLVLSPFLLAMLEPHDRLGHIDAAAFVNDVWSLVVPGQDQVTGGSLRTWLADRGLSWRAGGPSYLGLPLLALIGAFAWRHGRDRRAQLLLGTLAICLVASLGPRLTIGGDRVVVLPWELLVGLPLFDYAIPMRFAAFTFLAAAVLVAAWLSWRPGVARWALALAAIAVLLPDVRAGFWSAPAQDPAFFTTRAHERFLDEADHVLTIPVWGRNTRWAARTQIGFRIAGGYVGYPPTSYTRYPAWGMLQFGRRTARSARDLRSLIAAKGVTVVVLDAEQRAQWAPLLATLRVAPREVGGVLVYRLRPARR